MPFGSMSNWQLSCSGVSCICELSSVTDTCFHKPITVLSSKPSSVHDARNMSEKSTRKSMYIVFILILLLLSETMSAKKKQLLTFALGLFIYSMSMSLMRSKLSVVLVILPDLSKSNRSMVSVLVPVTGYHAAGKSMAMFSKPPL